MKYKFLASHKDWLPAEPTGVDMDSNMYFNHIVVPSFVDVGGIKAFAKYLHKEKLINMVTYSNDTEKSMSEELQNQLTAKGYPSNIIEKFHLFQTDSINGMLAQFARDDEDIRHRNDNNWLPMNDEYTLKLKDSVKMTDLQRFGFDGTTAINPRKPKSTGHIRWLRGLPTIADTGAVDIGAFTRLPK